MTAHKPKVGAKVDDMSFAVVGRSEPVSIGQAKDRWTMLFVYRGKHCPRCKRFLNKLNDALPAWTSVLDVIVVSADTEEKAAADKAEFGWDFDLCYGMTEAQMRAAAKAHFREVRTSPKFAPGYI